MSFGCGCALVCIRYVGPWEGVPLGLALSEARVSLVLTMACGVRHYFLNVRDFEFHIIFRIP